MRSPFDLDHIGRNSMVMGRRYDNSEERRAYAAGRADAEGGYPRGHSEFLANRWPSSYNDGYRDWQND